MSLYYVLVFGIIALFSATVIWALWWALRGGQFSDFAKGAHSIFDEGEPPGRSPARRRHAIQQPVPGMVPDTQLAHRRR